MAARMGAGGARWWPTRSTSPAQRRCPASGEDGRAERRGGQRIPDRLAGGVDGGLRRGVVDAPLREGRFGGTPRLGGLDGRQPGVRAAAGKILIFAARGEARRGLAYSLHVQRNENEGVVGEFLKTHPEFSPAEFALPGVGRSKDGMLRLWPHRLSGDGHFAALLKRAGQAVPAPRRERIGIPDKQIAKIPGCWAEALEDCVLLAWERKQDVLPPEMPDLSGLRVLRQGLRLGEWYKYAEPNHAWRWPSRRIPLTGRCSLDDDRAAAFLRARC